MKLLWIFGLIHCRINNSFCTTVCYDDVGCFPFDYPWTSATRPLPPPKSPKSINTKLYLYTRNHPQKRTEIVLRPSILIPRHSDYKSSREFNVFIIHGYVNNANFTWMIKLKDAYLKKRDANVFLVDWGNSALSINYLQAASDIRVVAAEIVKFTNQLIQRKRVNVRSFHLIGHSLGAHAAGYVGKRMVAKPRQITGLDPAQPGFEDCDPKVRLDKNDAQFVDVLHTNARPLILFGLGMILPVGDVDVYINGGTTQPGCPHVDRLELNIHNLQDFERAFIENSGGVVTCSHLKSIDYYTEAIENSNCMFWARAAHLSRFVTRLTNGILISPIILTRTSNAECSLQTCTTIGLQTPQYPATGVFSLKTNAYKQYCQEDEKTTKHMVNSKQRMN